MESLAEKYFKYVNIEESLFDHAPLTQWTQYNGFVLKDLFSTPLFFC